MQPSLSERQRQSPNPRAEHQEEEEEVEEKEESVSDGARRMACGKHGSYLRQLA